VPVPSPWDNNIECAPHAAIIHTYNITMVYVCVCPHLQIQSDMPIKTEHKSARSTAYNLECRVIIVAENGMLKTPT